MKKIAIILVGLSVFLVAKTPKVPVAFKANFKQVITGKNGNPVKYRGKLRLNSEGDLKWSYSSPTKKEVCSSDQNVIVVDHYLEQVSFVTVDQSLNLPEILRNSRPQVDNKEHDSGYNDRLYVANYEGKNYTFGLDTRGRIEQIAYMDDMDNRVNVYFSNMKYLKKPIAYKYMKCKYPNNYDMMN